MHHRTDKLLVLDVRSSMVSFWPLRFFILLALNLLLVTPIYAQGPAADCNMQNASSGCVAGQPSSASTGSVQSKSSSAPKVTYRDGQLTIRALNVSLGDLLRAVSTQTGAVIEFPAERAGDAFSAQAGPGPVRDVLATLLNGSRFNYVMLGSTGNPNLLQRMILTNADQPAGSAPSASSGQPPVIPQQTASVADSDNSEDAVPPVPTAAPVAMQISNPEHLEPPKEPLSPEVLKQMVHDRMAARQQQAPQQSEPAQ
jgi:hypothetical protein